MRVEQPGVYAFTQLSDVPQSYLGQAAKTLSVRLAETGLEFVDSGGGGGAVDFVSNVATSTLLGRITAGTGDSEQLTPAEVRTLINVADGATANVGNVVDADVRGGAVDLNARLGTISNFASPNAGGVISNQYYDNSFQGTASSILVGIANTIMLAPYYTSQPLTISQIGVVVTTAVAASFVKIVIYATDANGWPDVLLYESSDIDTSVATFQFESLTFTFDSGVQYWVGVRFSGIQRIRSINTSSAVNLGMTASTATSYATILRQSVTYANAAPNPWVFVNAHRITNVTPPSIRFRAA